MINYMRYLTLYKTGFVLDDFAQLAARVGGVLSVSEAGWLGHGVREVRSINCIFNLQYF